MGNIRVATDEEQELLEMAIETMKTFLYNQFPSRPDLILNIVTILFGELLWERCKIEELESNIELFTKGLRMQLAVLERESTHGVQGHN